MTRDNSINRIPQTMEMLIAKQNTLISTVFQHFANYATNAELLTQRPVVALFRTV